MTEHTPNPSAPPPLLASQPPPLTVPRPRVVPAYRLWCGFFVLIYIGMLLHSVLIARGQVEPSLGLIEGALVRDNPQARAELFQEKRQTASELVFVTGAVALVYLTAALLPRRKWTWGIGLAVIITTLLPFVVTAAGMVPLLIHWCKPEVKRYFAS